MKSLYKLSVLGCLYVVFYSAYALGHLSPSISHTGYAFKNSTHYTVHLRSASCQQYRSTTKKCISRLALGPKQISYIFVAPAETDPPIMWKMQLTDTKNRTVCNSTVHVSFYKYRNIYGGYNYKPSMRYAKFCKGLKQSITYTCNKISLNDYCSSEMHITYKP